jgi:hypothetical protein
MVSASTLSLEETKPELIDGAQFIPFTTHVTYLKNANTGDFLKLSSHEAVLARYFNGKFTLAEILNKHLETVGTKYLVSIAEILYSLRTRGFIKSADIVQPGLYGAPAEHAGLPSAVQSPAGFISRDLYRFRGVFKNRIFEKMAGFLSSSAGLACYSWGPRCI